MPKLSVIVPVYKVEAYLDKCIQSIQNQTFEDLELILVDDGSPDNCGAICDEYAMKDKRIHVIHQKNGGLSAARNAGIDWAFANSDSEFLSFIDSDDFIEPEMYEVMMKLQEKHGADMVQCEHCGETDFLSVNQRAENDAETVLDGKAFLKKMFALTGARFTNSVSACSKIYRKTLFEHIRYPDGRVFEDEGTTHKICIAAEKIVITDACFYHYIQRKGSIIKTLDSRKLHDKQLALLERYRDLSVYDPCFAQITARQFYCSSYSTILSSYKAQNRAVYELAKETLLDYAPQIRKYLDKYGKVYLIFLRIPFLRKWLLHNDWEPIQNVIRQIKKSV